MKSIFNNNSLIFISRNSGDKERWRRWFGRCCHHSDKIHKMSTSENQAVREVVQWKWFTECHFLVAKRDVCPEAEFWVVSWTCRKRAVSAFLIQRILNSQKSSVTLWCAEFPYLAGTVLKPNTPNTSTQLKKLISTSDKMTAISGKWLHGDHPQKLVICRVSPR